MTNRVVLDRPVVVRSVSGPQFTAISGDAVMRCVYLTNGAALSGFTLTNGYADSGGGIWCESTNALVTNCTLTGNSAWSKGGGAYSGTLTHCMFRGNMADDDGGGAAGGTLNNCTLTGNSASWEGGGAAGGTLNNCTLTGNSAQYGGGVLGTPWDPVTLNNCILYYNTASSDPNYSFYPSCALNYCCTTPDPGNGTGNINAEPLFVDLPKGNLRLQSSSPCINAGLNANTAGATDLDGRPRIIGGTVDIGAYEYQGPAMGEFIAWLQQYSLPTDGSADFTDPDLDLMNNWQEWQCGTDPTNALSVLRLFPPTATPEGVAVSWLSVTNRTYFLERSTDLGASPAFLILATGIPGQPSTTTFTDTNLPGPCFYRVGTEP